MTFIRSEVWWVTTYQEWARHLYWLTGRGGRPVIVTFGEGSGLEMLPVRFS